VPSYVASGIAPFFQGYPTGTQVQSSLSLKNSDVEALPTQVLNIPPYANYTKNGWNVRFHGNVYKQPDVSNSTLNDLANVFLPNVDIKNLPPSQAAQARNLTAEIFVLQQGEANVSTITLEPAAQDASNSTVSASGGSQQVTLPYQTTPEGDFDVFVPIDSSGLTPGNETQQIQTLNTYVEGASLGNATAYLVPDSGLTIISDIDDILRVTKIYEPEKGLLNTFARPFTPWMNMPDIYANWSQSLTNMHFHYLTTTPEQITRNYMQFIYATYPLGSFDTRPLNFSNLEETIHVRKYLLDRIFNTFPNRKFILVADTSNSDVMKDYPQMAIDYPGQVQCIFLRNTSATDPGDKFPYDTSGFKNLKQEMYMFFITPDDLTNLDIENGQCYNTSVRQNVTFGYQGLPFGLSDNESGASAFARREVGWVVLALISCVFWNLL
jgi:phosphatidate phosphatase APP1